VAITVSGVEFFDLNRYVPVLWVDLTRDDGGLTVPAIIDSGANATLVPAQFLAPFGVEWDGLADGPTTVGVGGQTETRLCPDITLSWGRFVIRSGVMVADPCIGLPCVLLGLDDFFRKFEVTFRWAGDSPTIDIVPAGEPQERDSERIERER
jgi:hypothetical protein